MKPTGFWLFASFLAGVGWGQWWSEYHIRQERAALEKGRLTFSVPADPEDAADTLELLSVMVRKVQQNRQRL